MDVNHGVAVRNVVFLTIHLPLVRKYDLPPAAGRVYGQSLVEALLNVWAPHSFGVTVQSAVRPVSRSFPIAAVLLRPIGAATATPLRRNDDGL